MKKSLAICIGLTMLAANGAFADISADGDPVEGNSWSQGFNESGVGLFDLVAVKMVSPAPDSFQSLTHRNLPSGWSVVYETPGGAYPTLATATGPARTNMTWTIVFAGSSSNPLAFDFVAFNGNTLLESAHAVWGPGWRITAGNWNPTRAELVPVPGAVLLGILGLGAVGVKLRKYA